MIFGMTMIRQSHPGIMELSMLLQTRQNNHWTGQVQNPLTDRQIAIFIASHYRATITNNETWNGPIALSMIKGDQRRFAEQSVAEHPAPTQAEIADADAAIETAVSRRFEASPPPLLFVLMSTLIIYVCIPALIAAVLFRGGLVLLMAGITFVRRDGRRASRLRVFWRALVAWMPFRRGAVPGFRDHFSSARTRGVQYSAGLDMLRYVFRAGGPLPGFAGAGHAGPPRRNLARAAVSVTPRELLTYGFHLL